MNHAIRISRAYQDLSGIVAIWSSRSQKTIAYQHDADEKIEKTHVHIALFGCDVQAEALKRMWPEAPGKGNKFWCWKTKYENKDGNLVPVDENVITYMSKGQLTPCFSVGFADRDVDNLRSQWIPRDKAETGDYTERIVSQIVAKFNIKKETRYHRSLDEIEFGQPKYNLSLLFDNVRTESWKTLWAQRRMAPHGAHYKQVACTVFMRICEANECFNHGIGYVMDKWY